MFFYAVHLLSLPERTWPRADTKPHTLGVPCTVPSTVSDTGAHSISGRMDELSAGELWQHTLNGLPNLLIAMWAVYCEWKQACAEACVDTVGQGPAWRLNSENPSVPGPCSSASPLSPPTSFLLSLPVLPLKHRTFPCPSHALEKVTSSERIQGENDFYLFILCGRCRISSALPLISLHLVLGDALPAA